LASMSAPTTTIGISVVSAAYSQLQILVPNQVADPGKPISNPSGRIGSPNSVSAGNPVTVTVNAVDPYFNLVNTVTSMVNFSTSDVGAPPQTPPATLAAGTASHSDILITVGNQTITGVDGGGKTGTTDPIQVLPGINSTTLNVVHASPILSTVVLVQSNIALF